MIFLKIIVILTVIVLLTKIFWLPVLVIPNLMPTNKIRPLEWISRKPDIQTLSISSEDINLTADLYLPKADVNPEKLLILIHGVNETGKDDARIKNFGQTLARSGIVTLIPTYPNLLRSSFSPQANQEVKASIDWFQDRYEGANLGLISFSVAGGPMFIAANSEDVDLLLAFGSHYELKNMLKYTTTKTYSFENQTYTDEPDPFGKEILTIQYRKVFGIVPEVENVLNNTDPEKFDQLYEKIPAEIKQFLADLSPKDHLDQIKTEKVLLVHSIPDTIVPHTESQRLKVELKNADLTFLRIFSHVTIQLPKPTPSKIINYYIPEAWKLYRIIFSILSFG